MWKLTIEDDEGQQTSLDLARQEYTVGRADGNTICLTERNVSRHHAVMRWSGQAWSLQDLNSYNGTYINGQRVVDSVELKTGDIVQLADYRIELMDAAAIAAAEARPSAAQPPEQRRPSRLIMVIGPAPGAEFILAGEYLAIGRAEEAAISINHSSVSRNHAEMHAFGDGRWEIIDLGSSNGIRINGVELKRGILEPGDALELGDVRLRFVGAGKYFRPISQISPHLLGLEAGAQPEALATSVQRSMGKIIAIGAVVAILVIVAWVMIGPAQTAGTEPTPGGDAPMATNLEAAKELLAEAAAIAEADIHRAHAMLQRVPEESPVREEQEYKDIENRWADAVFEQVEKSKDPKEKSRLLNEILRAAAVDQERRQRAADMLLELGEEPAPIVRPGGHPVATRPGGGTTPTKPGPGSAPTATPSETAAETTAAPKPKGDTKFDENAQRRALEARVWSGNASEAEIRMLRAICSNQGDRACRDRATQMLKAKRKEK